MHSPIDDPRLLDGEAPPGFSRAAAVLGPWSLGHLILYDAELPVVANNFGYGFLDGKASADLIIADNEQGKRIRIDTIAQGAQIELPMTITTAQNLRVVLCWADPEVLILGDEFAQPNDAAKRAFMISPTAINPKAVANSTAEAPTATVDRRVGRRFSWSETTFAPKARPTIRGTPNTSK